MSAGAEDDDVAVMRRLSGGDDLALNEIMGRWKEPVFGFCFQYLGNRADAAEVVQETFVRVYLARVKYRAEGKFSSWLFTIAANLCKMRVRWRVRHPEQLEGSMAEDTIVDLGDPAESALRGEMARVIRGEIVGLSHPLRTAFVLCEIEGMSQKEAAEISGCSAKAIERRLAKAKERLRAALGGYRAEN